MLDDYLLLSLLSEWILANIHIPATLDPPKLGANQRAELGEALWAKVGISVPSNAPTYLSSGGADSLR
jgi:hypothetical protein